MEGLAKVMGSSGGMEPGTQENGPSVSSRFPGQVSCVVCLTQALRERPTTCSKELVSRWVSGHTVRSQMLPASFSGRGHPDSS